MKCYVAILYVTMTSAMKNFFFTAAAVDDYDTHFDKTIETLPLLAQINEIHSQKMQDMKMTTPDFHLPALHEEVFDSG